MDNASTPSRPGNNYPLCKPTHGGICRLKWLTHKIISTGGGRRRAILFRVLVSGVANWKLLEKFSIEAERVDG